MGVQFPVLTSEVEKIVVSKFPIPKPILLPTKLIPKSSAGPPTSASIIPLPFHQLAPVVPICVVFIQYSMVKSSAIPRLIVTLSSIPSKLNAPRVEPHASVGAILTAVTLTLTLT